MTNSATYDDELIGQLVGFLPPAPSGWVRAAQEIPAFRRMLDDILVRAEADEAFRRALIADLEAAIADAGYEPGPRVVEELRRELES
jgi:hypothetical protein